MQKITGDFPRGNFREFESGTAFASDGDSLLPAYMYARAHAQTPQTGVPPLLRLVLATAAQLSALGGLTHGALS